MSTIESSGKVAYVYETSTSTWHPVAGTTSTGANYAWTGTHSFASSVSFADVVNAKGGVNNFLNPAARDAALPSPNVGAVAFVRQDSSGNVINDIQYYYQGAWREYNDSVHFISKTDNYTLTLLDAGKTIRVNAATDKTITIPTNASVAFTVGQKIEIIRVGAGEVTIAGASVAVAINSKNSNKRIASQYSAAVLVKDDTNAWILIGDLKA